MDMKSPLAVVNVEMTC